MSVKVQAAVIWVSLLLRSLVWVTAIGRCRWRETLVRSQHHYMHANLYSIARLPLGPYSCVEGYGDPDEPACLCGVLDSLEEAKTALPVEGAIAS